ncbi:hypothetical protein APY03_6161 [Variovorax sp. WDL1]|nr:hypothetical protein APY03_6161 [Variovorax sp. WDL1]
MARLMILGSLSMMGAQLVLYQRKHQGRKALAGGAWLIAIGFLCLLNTDQISLVYVAVFLVSLGVAWLTPSYTAILSLATDRQEAAAGALAVVHKIGYASGGLVTAAALYFNPDLPFVIAAALAFAAIALVQLALRAALRHSSSNPLEGGSSHAG